MTATLKGFCLSSVPWPSKEQREGCSGGSEGKEVEAPGTGPPFGDSTLQALRNVGRGEEKP